MIEASYIPHKIYIVKDSLDFPLTRRILKNTKQIPKKIINDPQEIIENLKLKRDPIQEGKKYILLTKQKGKFIKPCPCTSRYIGCNYFIINLELNCPLDCSYCILQDYLSNPLITVHVNLEDLWRELDFFIRRKKGSNFRIGTGELGDSLALDHITETSKDLISYFKNKKNALFELKTKTNNISNVLRLKPTENIIISWSLNSSKIALEQEKGAPAVEDRIQAARLISEKGFRVGFHFDPLIRYSGWQEDYREIVKMLLREIKPPRIAWISLGSLRFPPHHKSIIRRRFPKESIFYDEFIRGKDGKYRYFKPLRIEIYSKIVSSIRGSGGSEIPLYFCMEDEEIWRKVMNWIPRSKKEVEYSLSYPAVKVKQK